MAEHSAEHYSFHDEPLSKNIARRQLDRQHLLFAMEYICRPEQPFISVSMNCRGELDIDECIRHLACF